MKKHSDLAFKFRKHDFTVFYEKIVNNFLNSEQKIIYAKKRANNDGFAYWIPKSL